MKKITNLLLVILSVVFMSSTTLADESLNNIIGTKEVQNSSTKTVKKSRRKKVEMCNECGKPETQCECEGHGNDEKKHND